MLVPRTASFPMGHTAEGTVDSGLPPTSCPAWVSFMLRVLGAACRGVLLLLQAEEGPLVPSFTPHSQQRSSHSLQVLLTWGSGTAALGLAGGWGSGGQGWDNA